VATKPIHSVKLQSRVHTELWGNSILLPTTHSKLSIHSWHWKGISGFQSASIVYVRG